MAEENWTENRVEFERQRMERLRDEFAMAALTGIIMSYPTQLYTAHAYDAYIIADAMLEARKNG